jgi:hypothetical protein
MEDCSLFLLMLNTFTCPTSTGVLTFGHFGVAYSDSLTDSELQLLIEIEQDQTRHSFIL